MKTIHNSKSKAWRHYIRGVQKPQQQEQDLKTLYERSKTTTTERGRHFLFVMSSFCCFGFSSLTFFSLKVTIIIDNNHLNVSRNESNNLCSRSGATGTDGWISPEIMLNDDKHAETHHRTTCAVDIFSSGCLIYCVFTNGQHPFGDHLSRQANILSGHCRLDALDAGNSRSVVAHSLVTAMTRSMPTSRPVADSVLRFVFVNVWKQL